MKAWVLDQLDQFPVLTNIEMNNQEDKCLTNVLASSLNHRDLWISKGLYADIRVGSILGSDGCVLYENTEYILQPSLHWGEDENFQHRDFRVLGMPDSGTFAEQIQIERKYLFKKPSHLSTLEAAALPLAGLTAYRALFSKAKVTATDKVLITGIGGGVALFALQFSLAFGCEVFVSSSSESKIEKAKALGANGGYLYTDQDWSEKLIREHGGIAVIIDGSGGAGFHHLIKVCKPGARICIYGATAGKINNISLQPIFWKQISILGTTMGSDRDFEEMLNFVARHKVRPIIDEVFDFQNLDHGFEKMASGRQFGKIVFKH